MTWRQHVWVPQGPVGHHADVADVSNRLKDGGRFLSALGWQSGSLSPEATRHASIPSLNWYGPLLDKRFAALSGMTSAGWVHASAFLPENSALDIYGVRLAEFGSISPSPDALTPFVSIDGVRLGPGCNEANPSVLDMGRLTEALGATRVRVFSSLACGVVMADGETVASVETASGSFSIRAGIETVESAHRCLGTGPQASHPIPPKSFVVDSGACAATVAVADFELSDASKLSLRYTGASGGLVVHGLAFETTRGWVFLPPAQVKGVADGKWRFVRLTQSGVLAENRSWLPRLRFVRSARVVEDQMALDLVRGTAVGNGSGFHAASEALLESGALRGAQEQGFGAPEILSSQRDEMGGIALEISPIEGDSLLLLGDNFNKSWQATADGKHLVVLRANYNQVAVKIPPDSRHITLKIEDRFVSIGSPISLLFALTLVLLGRRPQFSGADR